MRIVLTGGGTGGHVTPLVVINRKLKERLGDKADILYVGSGVPIERDLILKEGIKAKWIFCGKKRRYFSLKNFSDFFKTIFGIIQSLWILLMYMPDVIFSKGGYVSLPVVLAGWIYRIPIIVHESDAIPGSTNKILGKFANNVILAYDHAQPYFETSRTAIFGNPVRAELVGGNREEARAFFDFTEIKPVILVLGGSQGSQLINRSILEILPILLSSFQVIHQTGDLDFEETLRASKVLGIKDTREGYFPIRFMDTNILRHAYALADLVISRAGATSIAELAANGKASILIPLKNSANDHQRMNAYEIAKVGGTLVLEEDNLGKNILADNIIKIMGNPEMKEAMGQKIVAFYHPQAGENIVDGIIQLGEVG